VCVAPDGSLVVTDWYDPGVGGHAQGDINRGRIFRVAPKGSKLTTPHVDLSSVDGAIEALKSPNAATRFLAFTKLREAGEDAEFPLRKLGEQGVPHERARALWIRGLIKGKAEDTVKMAIADQDPRVRAAGVRMAREWKVDLMP